MGHLREGITKANIADLKLFLEVKVGQVLISLKFHLHS